MAGYGETNDSEDRKADASDTRDTKAETSTQTASADTAFPDKAENNWPGKDQASKFEPEQVRGNMDAEDSKPLCEREPTDRQSDAIINLESSYQKASSLPPDSVERAEAWQKFSNDLKESPIFDHTDGKGKDEAVLYSGGENRKCAELYAKENEKTTLEQTPVGEWLEKKQLYSDESGVSKAEARQAWDNASKGFCEQASEAGSKDDPSRIDSFSDGVCAKNEYGNTRTRFGPEQATLDPHLENGNATLAEFGADGTRVPTRDFWHKYGGMAHDYSDVD